MKVSLWESVLMHVIHNPCECMLYTTGAVSISDVTYESPVQTLVCTSTGGPATSVTWSRDNTPLVVDGTTYEHSQIIMNTHTATYQNRLRIVDKSASLSGMYTCSVGNEGGQQQPQ